MTMVGHGGSSWRRDGERERKKIQEKMRKNGCVQQQQPLRTTELCCHWPCVVPLPAIPLPAIDHNISLTQIEPISASFYLKPIASDLSLFDYGLVWEWMSWVLCWVSILWMVWFGSGFVDVVVDDLIRWWCFAGCWAFILLLGFNLHVL